MPMIVVVKDLHQPIDVVWSEIANFEQHVQWMADAERIDFLTDQRRGTGTRMSVRTRVGPFSTNDILEVWDWSEGERIGVFHHGLVSGIGMFVLAPTEGGTRFVWWEHLTFPWYLGGVLTATLAAPILKLIWIRNLNRFARSIT